MKLIINKETANIIGWLCDSAVKNVVEFDEKNVGTINDEKLKKSGLTTKQVIGLNNVKNEIAAYLRLTNSK